MKAPETILRTGLSWRPSFAGPRWLGRQAERKQVWVLACFRSACLPSHRPPEAARQLSRASMVVFFVAFVSFVVIAPI